MVSITEQYRDRINELKKKLDLMVEHYDLLPDAPYQVFSLEAEIRDQEMRSELFNLRFSRILCGLCKQPVFDEDTPIRLGMKGHFLICPRCIKTIRQVKGTSELEQHLGLTPGTVKQDCEGPLRPLQAEGLVRKSGKCWLVHVVVEAIFYRTGRQKRNLMNSWIQDLADRLELLQRQKDLLESLRPFPDAHSQIFSLQAQIQDIQMRLDRIQGGKLPYRCSQCGVWLKQKGKPTFFGIYTICDTCKGIVTSVMTTAEAEIKHDLPRGTIRRDIARGLLEQYIESGLLRRSGNIWLLHEVVVLDRYKELSEEQPASPVNHDIPSDLLQRSATIFQRVMANKYS